MACKWQRKNPCWSTSIDYSQFDSPNKHSANISNTPRKAHHQEPAKGSELVWVWGWELVLAAEMVLEVVLELVLELELELVLAKNH